MTDKSGTIIHLHGILVVCITIFFLASGGRRPPDPTYLYMFTQGKKRWTYFLSLKHIVLKKYSTIFSLLPFPHI